MERAGSGSAVIGRPPPAANPASAAIRLDDVARSAQQTKPYEGRRQKARPLAVSQVGMSVDALAADKAAGGARRPARETGGASKELAGSGTIGAGGVAGSDDSIFTALSHLDEPITRDGRPALADENLVVRAPPSPAPPNNNINFPLARPVPVPGIETLVAAPSRARPIEIGNPRGDPGEHVMRATHWLPRGEIIPVYIMQTVQTGKFPTLVQFAVARTVWFNGKPVLPFGTRFMASAGLGVRDRILFNIDSLQRRDGLEIAVSGMVLGPDQATGLPGYYVPPPTLVQLAPYIGNFAEAYGNLLKLRLSKNSYQVGAFGVNVTPDASGNPTQEIALSAASQALGDFIASQVSDLRERYAAYLAIPAGTPASVQLTANTDLSALWDASPRGIARTVGDPRVIPTELLYRQRELEKLSQSNLAAVLAQAAAGSTRGAGALNVAARVLGAEQTEPIASAEPDHAQP